MYEDNPFILSKDDIITYTQYGLFDSEDESNNHKVRTFQFNNLIVGYNFGTNQTTLCKEVANDQYEILYECSNDGNDLCKAALYLNDNVYILNNYNSKTGFIGSLVYTSKDEYLYSIDKFYTEHKNIISQILSYKAATRYVNNHFTRLVYNNKL